MAHDSWLVYSTVDYVWKITQIRSDSSSFGALLVGCVEHAKAIPDLLAQAENNSDEMEEKFESVEFFSLSLSVRIFFPKNTFLYFIWGLIDDYYYMFH